MDPRVRAHAETIVEHSTDVQPGDDVVIVMPPVAENLVVALYEAIAARDARPLWLGRSGRAARAMMRAADPDEFDTPEHTKALVEASDVIVSSYARTNATELSDVPPEKTQVRARAQKPISEAARDKTRCLTLHPTAAGAQLADVSTEAYEAFVYDAVNRDWDAVREYQQQLVEILDPADEVRVVSGDRTDVTMSVAGMDAVNDYGETNLPGGEVFTAPVPESVEGTVHFDLPVYRQGREIRGATLTFEGGEVTEFAAAQNEDLLGSILDTDDGARRLGELGIGMNRAIDRFTYNMLFDEKMGDTVHFALGRAIEESVPDDADANDSATHVDMLVDVSEDSFIEVDGEVVQRDGTFRFEE
jgi:aminopeptidase